MGNKVEGRKPRRNPVGFQKITQGLTQMKALHPPSTIPLDPKRKSKALERLPGLKGFS